MVSLVSLTWTGLILEEALVSGSIPRTYSWKRISISGVTMMLSREVVVMSKEAGGG